jgi:hypothetical protein
MLWPTRFQCSGVWISSGHHCIYPYSWTYGYSILSGTKLNLHRIFQKVNKWKNICIGVKKVKCTLVQALRLCTGRTAHRGSRGIALLFHDHGTGKGWGVSITTWSLFTPGKDPVPIVQKAGWAPGPVWTGAENLAPHQDSIPGPSSP